MNTERARYESWAISKGHPYHDLEPYGHNGSVDRFSDMAWEAWQAGSAQDWRPMDYAPKKERILIKAESGERYAAHWVKHPVTDHEAWMICGWGDGEQAMCDSPIGWMPLPPDTAEIRKG